MLGRRAPLSALIFASLLAACGGGSSSSGGTQPPAQTPPPPPPPPPPEPSPFDTAEFRRNYGLGSINAIPAYEAGATGNGIIVNVIDTGIDRDHPELIGRIHPASSNAFDASLSVEDEDGHGTLVAGVIAANRNGVASHGVAFNAQILAIRAEDPSTCDEEDGCVLDDFDIATGVNIARQNGADIINLSLGGDGASNVLLTAINQATAEGIIVVVSAGNADDETTDEQRANPSGFAQDLALSGAGNGRVIIVGATDSNNQLADFSHQAGNAASVYVVAPGVQIFTTNIGGGNAIASGTSFSAPHVAGALALLIELFPNLTADEVIDLLLSTTVDLGAVGTDPIFGRGLIDLGEALDPQGTTTVSVATVNGVTPVPTDGSGGQTPSAFGAILAQAPLINDAVFLDAYERGYHFDLGNRLVRSNTLPSLFSRIDQNRETAFSGFQIGDSSIQFSAQKQNETQKHLRSYLGDVAEHLTQTTQPRYQFRTNIGSFELGLAYGYDLSQELKGQSPETELFLSSESVISAPQSNRQAQSVNFGKALENGRLSFGFSFSDRSIDNPALFGTELLKNRRAQNLAARYDRYFKSAAFGAELGVIRENGQLLGAPSAGALALGDGATTAYLSFDGEVDAGPNWIISARADITRTSVNQAQSSIFSDIGSFTATSFRLNAYRSAILGKEDRLGFSISQPLKVETGSAQVTVPTAVAYSPGHTQVLFDEARFSLSPDAREIDVEIGYSWRLDNGLSLKANMLRQFNAGHVAGQSGNAVLFRMARAF